LCRYRKSAEISRKSIAATSLDTTVEKYRRYRIPILQKYRWYIGTDINKACWTWDVQRRLISWHTFQVKGYKYNILQPISPLPYCASLLGSSEMNSFNLQEQQLTVGLVWTSKWILTYRDLNIQSPNITHYSLKWVIDIPPDSGICEV